MDWLMERTVHRGCSGCTLGREVFTDLDFADDTALLAEMLEVLLLAPEVMNEEATPLGLEINWLKTKIQEIGEYAMLKWNLSSPLFTLAVHNTEMEAVTQKSGDVSP